MATIVSVSENFIRQRREGTPGSTLRLMEPIPGSTAVNPAEAQAFCALSGPQSRL
jgi:hypothetical protein